jgi:predicted  nucleic acid-binding Zn-ribbon protein
VSVETFYSLKEIESLKKMQLTHEACIHEQEDRLLKLQERLKVQELNIQTAQDEIVKIKSEIILLEKRLQDRLDEVTKTNLESQQWDFMIRIEELEKSIMEDQTFIIGFTKTMNEIDIEAQEIIQKENQELKNLELRIKLLIESLPDEVQVLLKKLQSLNLKFGVFTSIQDSSCRFCRRKLSRVEEDEIDIKLKLISCASCRRLFLPYNIVSAQRY